MNSKFTGKAWVYGDNIDTDVIIPARYLITSERSELAKHCMEDIDKGFANEVREGDIVIGGNNFGCGSSREHAPLALQGAGVSCIIANSFARIFFRNAINVGLPILECDVAGKIAKGDEVEVDIESGVIINKTNGTRFQAKAFPQFLQELINEGGLLPYVKKRLSER